MRGLAAGLGLVALACLGAGVWWLRRPPPARPPPAADAGEVLLPPVWITESADTRAQLTSRGVGSACTVTCTVDGKLAWTRTDCLAKPENLRFVSNDCARVLVLYDAPLLAPTFSDTPVGLTVGAVGAPVRLRLGRFVKTNAGGKVSHSGRWVAWLKGTLGEGGQRPEATPDGAGVTFELLDGSKYTLTFEALGRWVDARGGATNAPAVRADRAAPAGPPRVVKASEEDLYQWIDADNVTQVARLADIPKRQRARAKRVKAGEAIKRGSTRE